MDIFGLGPMEILLILIIGLLIFGPEKLPKIGRDLGKALRAFRKASSDLTNEVTRELESKELENEIKSKQEAQKTDWEAKSKKIRANPNRKRRKRAGGRGVPEKEQIQATSAENEPKNEAPENKPSPNRKRRKQRSLTTQ